MMRSKQLALAAAVLATTGIPSAYAAYTTVYGGLTYDAATFTGYSGQQATGIRGGLNTAGTGTGLGNTSYYNDGAYGGVFAQRITTTGAQALGNLGTTNSGLGTANALSINASGTIAGYSVKYVGGASVGERPVLWLAGSTTPTELQTLGTSSSGSAKGVAYYVAPNGSAAGVSTRYDASGNAIGDRPVVWNASGNATELGALGIGNYANGYSIYGQTYVAKINNNGVAIGNVQTTDIGTRAVRWNAAGVATQLQPLGTSDGTPTGTAYAAAAALNDAGTAVGYSYEYVNGVTTYDQHATRWDASGNVTQLANIGTFGDGRYSSTANSINSSGITVGGASVSSTNDSRAVRWGLDGSATVLPTLIADTTYTNAYSINDAGLIAGTAQATGGIAHAVVWDANGGVLDLNTVIDPASGWVLSMAYTVTNDGWVAGLGSFDPDGSGSVAAYSRAFLVQVPEPTTLAFLGLAAVGLVRRSRRA